MNRQKQILDYISRHNKEKGYSPTMREIADEIKVGSTSTVFEVMKKLEEDGKIKRLTTRVIKVTDSDECIKVVKLHKGKPSVILWQGRRYVYDSMR